MSRRILLRRMTCMKKMVALLLAISIVTSTLIGTMPNMEILAANVKPALKKTSVHVLVGKTVQLGLKKKIAKSTIFWKSSKKKVAGVSKNGKVKGLRKGNARITATVTVNKKRYQLTCKVKVIQKAKNVVITYNGGKTGKNVEMVTGERLSLTISKTPKSSNDYASTWKSGNTNVASINNKGVVTAKGAGTSTITATMFGKAKASITVTVVNQDKDSDTGNASTTAPTNAPTASSASNPTADPTTNPIIIPTTSPTAGPSTNPTTSPAVSPAASPEASPAVSPATSPEASPATSPEASPAVSPTTSPEASPAVSPATSPEASPTTNPTAGPTPTVENPATLDMTATETDSGVTVTNKEDNSIRMEFPNANYTGAKFAIPLGMDLSLYSTFEVDATVSEQFGFYILDGSGNLINDYYPGYDITSETRRKFTDSLSAKSEYSLSNARYIRIQTQEKQHTPITVHSIRFYAVEKAEGSLKAAYQDYFKIGAAVTYPKLTDKWILENHIKHQYNSITMENEMKPESIMGDSPTLIAASEAEFEVPAGYTEPNVPQLNFDKVDTCLEIAKANGIGVRGHVLIWHNQTPHWFFKENYDPSGNLVSPDVMDKRMEYLVKQVLMHAQEKYPGVVYAWDVANEIFEEDGGVRDPGLREWESPYTSIYGDLSFAVKAFEYADRYRDPGVKLFYNDYNEYATSKMNGIVSFLNEVYQNGHIDGMGMQSHLNITYPSISAISTAIDSYASVGDDFEIHITELDITTITRADDVKDIPETELIQQAAKYEEIMDMLIAKKNDGVNITGVTFWGTDDGTSWLSDGHPLLFTKGTLKPKDAYYKVLHAPSKEIPTVTPTPSPTVAPSMPPLELEYDFDGSTQGFTGRGSATVTTTTYNGSPALWVTGRTADWHGAQINLSNVLKPGSSYEITAEMLHKASAGATIDSSFELMTTSDSKPNYPSLASATVDSDIWQTLKTIVTVEEFYSICLYFQTRHNETADFYLRNVKIREIQRDPTAALSYDSLAGLAEQYGFSLGSVANNNTVVDSGFIPILTKHFNSLTAGNEMKAYSLLNQKASMENANNGDGMPRMNYTKADKIMRFTRDHGIKVRGHVLVWDAYMTDWFFREGYASDGAFVGREVMLKRLESYIKQVLEHFQTEFPDVIYAWDVVNEAVSDSTNECAGGDPSRIRTKRGGEDNLFYTHIGRDYVKLSFQYARQYADPSVKLFYNDYNTIYPDKRSAICNLVNEINADDKLVDGVGMQCYLDRNTGFLNSYLDKNSASILDSVNAFHDLGVDVHLTELTVRNYSYEENAQHAEYYKSLFEVIKELNKEVTKISNVSIWGIVDEPDSKPGSDSYGLSGTHFGLFDNMYQPKESFASVCDALREGYSGMSYSNLETFETIASYYASTVKGDGGTGEVVDLGAVGAYSGTKALFMTTTDTWHGPQYTVTNRTENDLNVYVSAMVKTYQTDAGVRFAVEQMNNGTSSYSEYGKTTTGSNWQAMKASITVPAGTKVKIRIAPWDDAPTAAYYVDDYKIMY